MTDLVRVTTVLHELIPLPASDWWKPRHRLRGSLVDEGLTIVAQRKTIKADWWTRASGGDDPNNRVEHEECRPYIDAGAKFLAEFGFKLQYVQQEVQHEALHYVGHIDWIGLLGLRHIMIDLKVGNPPAADSPYDWYCRLQLAAYQAACWAAWRRSHRCANLYLQPDGYRFIERTVREDVADWKAMIDYYHRSRKWRETA
jgi:PD-(D/E)XK nuclease superfamily